MLYIDEILFQILAGSLVRLVLDDGLRESCSNSIMALGVRSLLPWGWACLPDVGTELAFAYITYSLADWITSNIQWCGQIHQMPRCTVNPCQLDQPEV